MITAHATSHKIGVRVAVVGTIGVVPTTPLTPSCPKIGTWAGGNGRRPERC